MFKISRRLDCAVQLLALLVKSDESTSQTAATIAAQLNIPLSFLYQVNNRLVRLGFIKAIPGPGGGLRLNRPPEKLTLLDVFIAIEGPAAFSIESWFNHDEPPRVALATEKAWHEMHEILTEHLKNITIKDIADKI